MASSYVNNLRLEEIATGEQSGTWGDTTNTNLEIIGQAVAWGTRAIANASSDNITIADGALDADRCLGLKLTGGGQACLVTLLPNTSSKTWFMYNATAAALTFTCGGGANVIIPAGHTKVIATDGLGSGGVVHDLLTAVNLAGTTTVDDLAVTDDLVVADDASVGGILGVTGVLTTTAATVFNGGFASNADSTMGTNKKLIFRDSAIHISSTADGDMSIAADDEIDITSTLIDINGNVEISGTLAQADALTMATNKKIIFRDSAIHISSTADGDLSIAADDEIDITSTLIDVNGNLDVSGTALVTGVLTTTAATVHTNGITMPDGAIAKFGTDDDLQISHINGTGSLIRQGGEGNLFIQGSDSIVFGAGDGSETLATFTDDGGCTLNFNNAAKIATTNTGVTVTGSVDASGTFLAGSSDSIFAENNLGFKSSGSAFIDHHTVDADIIFRTSDASALDTTALTLDGSDAGTAIFNHDAQFPDGAQVRLGADNDLKLHLSSTTGIVEATNGDLQLSGADDINIISGDNIDLIVQGNETAITCTGNAGVDLFHNNVKKFETVAGSFKASGHVDGTNFTLTSGTDNNYLALGAANNFGSNNNEQTKWTFRWRGRPNDGGHSLVLVDEVNSVIRFTVSAAGNFTVGTTTGLTSATGVLIGATGGQSNIINLTSVNEAHIYNNNNSTGTAYKIQFRQNNTAVGTITASANATAYATSSDYRLKENVEYNWDATTRLKQLKPARFNWITDDSNTLIDGFLAHEAQTVVPESVVGEKDAIRPEVLYVEGDELPDGKNVGDVKEASAPDYQQIDQAKLVPLLVKTIQELEARITALEG